MIATTILLDWNKKKTEIGQAMEMEASRDVPWGTMMIKIFWTSTDVQKESASSEEIQMDVSENFCTFHLKFYEYESFTNEHSILTI